MAQVTESSKKQLAILRRVVSETSARAARVDANNVKLRALSERALRRANSGSRQRIVERRVYRAAVVRANALRESNAKLTMMYAAASDLAVLNTARANIAISEGAKLVAEAKRAAKPAAGPVTKPAITETKRRVVSTSSDSPRTAALETGGKRRSSTVSNANRNGTTRIPGFI